MDNCSHQYGEEVVAQGREEQFNRVIHWPFTFWFQLGTCQQRNIFYLTQSPGQHRCSIRQPVLPNYKDHWLCLAQDDSTQLFLATLNTGKTLDLCKEGPQEAPYVTASYQSSWPIERWVDRPSKCRHMESNTWYLFTRDPDKQPDIAAANNRGKQFKWIQMDSRGYDCGHIQGKSLRWMGGDGK